MPETRHQLTYGQKLEVIDLYKKHRGMRMDDFLQLLRCKGFTTICEQTIRRYARNEDSIRRHVNSNLSNADNCRKSSAAHPEVEERLCDWIIEAEGRQLRLNGMLIRLKAKQIAKEIGIPQGEMIAFSDGWLTRFKQRWGLKHYVFHGEAGSAPVDTIDGHQQTLRQILTRYSPANRINVDETALPYRNSPTGGLASKALPGLKVDKTRLTYVVGTSQTGEKFKPLVIGRAKRPRCFKNGTPEDYGFYYRYNEKAWMTSVIWHEYLSILNTQMQQQDRHVLLLCDNASSHSLNGASYSHIEVAYLPPNLTSWLQPMDAGIIRTFKANYRRLLGLHALEHDANGVQNPYHVDQLDGMRLAQQAWDEVDAKTIQNCWRHTGICPEV
ncbi:tigger transposable element-derived protein [Ceratobasidium sp. AG-Ba]|nr:tigger transposable element-derived protein [Ceratobasidium sp. AG-Ba]QRV92375.1 tigger transposable element-derived protein [Ceratobasidium sp. AG-Ba]